MDFTAPSASPSSISSWDAENRHFRGSSAFRFVRLPMGYYRAADRADRAKAIAAVVVVHAALAAVILSGLNVRMIAENIDALKSFDVVEAPPPPPRRRRRCAKRSVPRMKKAPRARNPSRRPSSRRRPRDAGTFARPGGAGRRHRQRSRPPARQRRAPGSGAGGAGTGAAAASGLTVGAAASFRQAPEIATIVC